MVLLTLYGSDGKESSGDDLLYGSTLAHSATAAPISYLQIGMAGV